MSNMEKRKVALLAAAAIIITSFLCPPAFAASPEFARSEEEWARLRDNTMEYAEIEDLIHEYNVTVQNNEHDYNDKKEGLLTTKGSSYKSVPMDRKKMKELLSLFNSRLAMLFHFYTNCK